MQTPFNLSVPQLGEITVTHLSPAAGVVFDTATERARSVPYPQGGVSAETLAEHIANYIANPPALTAPRVQSARVVLARLTPAERAALRACTVPEIQDAYDIALIEGVISETDPDFPAFRTALDQLGIIATSRWPDLLAP